MRILFDTNVVLDVMLDREPFSEISAKLFSRVETGKVQGFLSATTITTIYYIAQKSVGTENALNQIEKLLALFEISPVNKHVLQQAINSGFNDFEDAVLYEAAKTSQVESIVTRNKKDFKQAAIPVLSPQEFFLTLDPH